MYEIPLSAYFYFLYFPQHFFLTVHNLTTNYKNIFYVYL
jgi:hypothetical protein